MSEKPIIDPDQVTSKLKSQSLHTSKFLGSSKLNFGAHKSDRDRIEKSLQLFEYLDNKPIPKPEHLNWQMRKRNKTAEIGPNM